MARTRAGYVFKGISPKQIELAAKTRVVKMKKKETQKEEEKPQQPKMGIDPLNPDGSVGVTFNQKMLAPDPDKIDQCQYSVAFKFNVEAKDDGSKTSSDFCSNKKDKKKRRLAEGKIEGEADKMAFVPAVQSHGGKKLVMNMTFDDPEHLSIGGTAQMGMEIKETSLFKSAETLESMTKDSFKGGKPQLNGGLPPQIADKE